MRVVAIIPARYASTRFPGKPLANETGKFLIQHVVERVAAAECFDRVLVATDDARIADAVASFGGDVAMTRADHATGTDRLAEVASDDDFAADDIIVNVQGDEPEIEPAALERLVKRLQAEPDSPVATLACPFPAGVDPRDPNRVKVVQNSLGQALYFSRSLIPYPREDETAADLGGGKSPWLLHLGVYAYRRHFLLAFAGWPPSPLEMTEKLEQLRILDRGRPIAIEVVAQGAEGIDTPADYARFVQRVREDVPRV